jgi:hypothetical protein
MGRFISSDTYPSTGQGLTGNNTFAYCSNNPITRKDSAGNAFETVFDFISLATSINDVIDNPADPWAWAGLVGDAVDFLIPCIGGIGEGARALKLLTKTAENTGKAVDAVSTAKKGWKLGDDITNLTNAGNIPSWSTVRQRFWKNEALYHPDLYPNDIGRMKKGLAPIGEDGFSMELHHPFGRTGDNYFIFEPVTRTRHQQIHYGE